MSDLANELSKIEFERKQLKEFVERNEAYQRLKNNPDFKIIILDWLLDKEAVRLVHLFGTPGGSSEITEKSILRQMGTISGLAEKFRMIETLGETAKHDLQLLSQTQDEIIAESNEV